jgi:NAD(P)-dependent dehydrogenase (short-subunit alcohol dehydrogenase family)
VVHGFTPSWLAVSDPTTQRLRGHVVLITGAASGIGRATALRAAGEGADIAAIGLDPDGLGALVDEVSAMGRRAAARPADVSDADALTTALNELVGELGDLTVVHANAGVLVEPSSIAELELAEWDRVLAVDLTGVMLTFQAGVRQFGERGGVLLATGSSLGVRPGVGYLPYVAAKAAVHALVRSLALELAPRDIRVNVIVPGLTDTPMTRGVPGHIERQLQGVPLGQLVEANDVAALAVHLMTDEARSITGSAFTIDAGRTAV